MTVLAAAVLLWSGTASAAAPVEEPSTSVLRGRVLDAQTGEAIAKATVTLPALKMETSTDAAGHFSFAAVPPGDVELLVTTIGYGLGRKTVRVSATETEVEIRVGQEALKRAEELVVEAPPFDPVDVAAPAAHNLRGVELRNLGGVITDDPLRSVQSLPGVATGDDFYANFATRGSGFSAVGFYLDGVLMNAPFHTIRDSNEAYSLTILNGDVVESLSLLGGGAPARYGDRTGAVLDVQTREGNREEFSGRASLGATGIYSTLEGPLGAGQKASWLVSARKSYLDYVLDRIDVEAGTVIGYYDVTGRLALHPTPTQTVGLTFLHGRSKWREGDQSDPNLAESARAGTDVGVLQWRHDSPAWRLGLQAFATHETGRNVEGPVETFQATTDQWGFRAEGSRGLGAHRVEGGLLLRHLGEQAVSRDSDFARRTIVLQDYDAGAAQWGGYVQDTWAPGSGRLSLTAGGRFDSFAETGETRVLPRASVQVALARRTRIMAAFGDHAQFPSFGALYGQYGNPDLEAERSRHVTFALEQGLGERTRVRVDVYLQEEDGLLYAQDAEWRRENGRVVVPGLHAPLRNALTGDSWGIETLLQRRSANGLSGWIAYSYGQARRRDEAAGLEFDSDFDQRHTVTLYTSYRLNETLNLSAKFRYGSGFPLAGFYRGQVPAPVTLAEERNTLRPDAYGRLDVRANKAWLFRGWKLTLFGEVINVFDRENARYDVDGIALPGGRVFVSRDTLFPLIPAVGVVVDF
jgi:hypothetical protein